MTCKKNRYKGFCNLHRKIKNTLAVNLFLLHFRVNTVLQAVSCLPGCLPEQSNDDNQLSTSYVLLRHDCFNILAHIDLEHACV